MNLSPHFTFAELTVSQTALRKGLDNEPSAQQVENLKRLCATILEPARDVLNVPLKVTSGFRSPAVNTAVGGSPTSLHMDGCAADIVPVGVDLRDAFATLMCAGLPFDELFIECGAWLHMGVARPGTEPRGKYKIAVGYPGHWTYMDV